MAVLRAVLLSGAALLLLLSTLPHAEAALGFEEAGDPNHPGMCYQKDSGTYVRLGSKWTLSDCREASCEQDDSGGMVIRTATCPVTHVEDPLCSIHKDPSLPYPHCCGVIACA